jgi:hypothetical protein
MGRVTDFDATDIATEMRERLRLKNLQITQWHIINHSRMERSGHVVEVSAYLRKRDDSGETIYWLDGAEARRDPYFTGFSAQYVAADLIAQVR